ncbi:hypothetical protein [Sphingobium aromaticiconvertens]|uniref:hypothetical protein n=1 Tax=Sphingobium aromaticiconvertens TaxID=365341 RepID=UPI003016BD8A
MNATPLPHLPVMNPDEAFIRQAVVSALTGRRCGDRVLAASLPLVPPIQDIWFACEGGVSLAIAMLDDVPQVFAAGDGHAAAALLDRADPLLAEVEAALSLSFDPRDIMDGGVPGGLIVQVDAFAAPDAAAHDRLLIALPPDIAILSSPAPAASELLGSLPVPVRLCITGPRLSPIDAATLSPGDLLLLGRGSLTATLGLDGGDMLRGRFDPQAVCFQPDPRS